MLVNGLLPIGTVVLLKESSKKVMIVGVAQKGASDGKLWDYVGVLFPEGYFAPDHMFLFNTDQIDELYVLGYQDAEQLAFQAKVDQIMVKLREQEQGQA